MAYEANRKILGYAQKQLHRQKRIQSHLNRLRHFAHLEPHWKVNRKPKGWYQGKLKEQRRKRRYHLNHITSSAPWT